MFSYNRSVYKSTNYCPYELLVGTKPYLPATITQEPKLNYTYDDYAKFLQHKLNAARENIIKSNKLLKCIIIRKFIQLILKNVIKYI